MSRPAVALPSRGSWTALAEALSLIEAVPSHEPFDVLACGNEAAELALRAVLEQRARVHALVLAAASPPVDADLARRVAELDVPTLAVFGTRDAAVPPAVGRRWRALLPGCHLVFVYDAGGDLAHDRPEAYAAVILEFLADPGSFLVNHQSGKRYP